MLNDFLEVNGIYDSGSNISLMNSKLIKINEKKVSNSERTNIKTINGVRRTDGLICVKIIIFAIETRKNLIVINSEYFNHDILFGLDCTKEFNLYQDKNLKITQVNIQNKIDRNLSNNENIEDNKILKRQKQLTVNFNEHFYEKNFEIQVNHLNCQEKSEVDNLIEEYKEIFAKDKYDAGTVKNYEAHIDLLVEKYTKIDRRII